MRHTTPLRIAAIALTLALAGCAGTSFTWDQARQIKAGMSEQELVAIMGTPYSVRASADGQLLYQWVYADLYGVAGGTRVLNVPIKNNAVITAPPIPESFK